MPKTAYHLCFLLFLFPISAHAQIRTEKFEINIRDFTTTLRILGPKDIIRINQDSIFIYHEKHQWTFQKKKMTIEKLPDTLVYTAAHSLDIIGNLNDIDTLERIRPNWCLIGGMIFFFRAEFNGKEYSTWISNAYHKEIFLILDKLNPVIPDQYRIRYDIQDIQRKIDECEILLSKELE